MDHCESPAAASQRSQPLTNRRPARAHHPVRATLLAVLAASNACYSYVPNRQSELAVGEEVRVHLTSTGSTVLQPVVGADVAAIDGRVTARTDSAYALSVGGTTKRAGETAVWTGEPITIPTTAIASADRRVLNRRKTFLVSALSVAGAALAAVVISAVSGGGSTGTDTGTTPP
jgi:hypothetical protein